MTHITPNASHVDVTYQDPSELRLQLRQRRQTLTQAQQLTHAQAALQHFKDFIQNEMGLKTGKKVALFLAMDGELNPQPTIEWLWDNTTHELYLPVLNTRQEWCMGFAPYQKNTPMQANQFAIAEPMQALQEHLGGEQMDMVIMPLVGFDTHGHRLGMGGGFYDRTFAFKKDNPEQSPLLIGWAHSLQCIPRIPAEPWDIPLDGVICETGFKRFSKQS